MYTWIFFFTVFLKNRNIISKIKRSKVTDYAALKFPSISVFSLDWEELLHSGDSTADAREHHLV